MPNQVFGGYSPTTWVDNVTMGAHTIMNNLETQASVALHSFNGDLLTPFVLSGCVATRNGTNLQQLDVTAGSVYIKMSDNTIGLIATIASVTNQFLTSAPSTTYFLDINPDGSWSFATSHSAVTNHLTIASCTTDASSNILAVTDARTLNTSLFPTMAGSLALPFLELLLTAANAGIEHGSMAVANTPFIDFHSSGNVNDYDTRLLATGGAAGTGNGFLQILGAGLQTPKFTSIGGQVTTGSLGAPVIVAQALNVHVTATTIQTLLNYTVPVTGLYRVSGGFEMGNTSNALINFGVGWVGGGAGLPNLNGYFNDGASFFNGVSAITHGWAYAIQPLTFYAQAGAGSTITVQYTDRSGAPNDWVTAQIERLA